MAPAVWTDVTSAKTVDSAPRGHMLAISTSIGIESMKLTTCTTTSSPMANQKLGRPHSRQTPKTRMSCEAATAAPIVMSVPKSRRSATPRKNFLYTHAPRALAAVPSIPMYASSDSLNPSGCGATSLVCLPAKKELKASPLPGFAAKMKRKTVGFHTIGSFITSHTCPSSTRTLAQPLSASAVAETRGSEIGSVHSSVSTLTAATPR